MPISAKQIERRKNYIGASDVGAIMGLSPWRTAYDVYLEKTGKLEDEKKEEEYKTVGKKFEEGILRLAESQLGKLLLNQFRVLQGTKLASNCDALVIETGRPAEAKLRRFDDNWGKPNTDEVPDDVIIQAQCQLLCTGKDLCHIVAILAARGFRLQLFFVPADKEIGKIIIETVDNFWRHHIERDIPPEDSMPSVSVIKRIRREANSIIDIPKYLVEAREKASDLLKVAQQQFDITDLDLKTALGTAEAGRFDGGLVTYLTQHRKAYQVNECEYRVLRIKMKGEKNGKGKKQY